jgi:hypothetical protein
MWRIDRCRLAIRVSATILVGSAALGTGVSQAQFPGRPQRQPQRVEPNGTIALIGRGVIALTTAAGETWRVQVAPNAQVQVLGTATPDVLAPGQYVAFTAQVDKKRAAVQDKVTKLKIFTPSEHQMVGAFPGQGGLGAGGLGAGAGGAPPVKQDRGAAADTGPPVEEFEIGAQIRSIKKPKLSLFAPNPFFRPTFEIELAEEPEISLDLAGMKYAMLAKPGDRIQARGTQVGPNAAQVNEVTIELAEPWGSQQAAANKRPTRRKTRSSRRAAAQAEADAEEEVEEKDENP